MHFRAFDGSSGKAAETRNLLQCLSLFRKDSLCVAEGLQKLTGQDIAHPVYHS